MMTLKERFQTLIADSTNSSKSVASFKFKKLAMENPENFQLALAVKEQWNQEHGTFIVPPLISLLRIDYIRNGANGKEVLKKFKCVA